MLAKPELHPLAARHLAELRDRIGGDPTIEEAMWIVQLCDRVLCPFEGERSDLCGYPVRCGISSTYIWPMTVGASVWFQDYASAWWGRRDSKLYFALAYALANGRDREAMRAVAAGRREAEAAITAWAKTLTCTREELDAAIDVVLPPRHRDPKEGDTPADSRPAKIDWERIVGEIEAATGIPADHWLWEVSRDATIRAWERSKAVLLARSGRGSGAGILDPLNTALQDLAQAKAAIIKAHEGTGSEQ